MTALSTSAARGRAALAPPVIRVCRSVSLSCRARYVVFLVYMHRYPFEGVYGYGNGGVPDPRLGQDAAFRFRLEF